MEGDLACFDDLVVLDETLVRKGYDEGMRLGSTKGDEEGAQLGRMKGAEMAVRVAVYRGRLDACRTIRAKHPSAIPKRAMVAIEQAAQALEEAESNLLDPRSQVGFDALELVESKLLAVGSLLKLSQRPSERPQTLEF